MADEPGLKDWSDERISDAMRQLQREAARRAPQKAPSEMNAAEFAHWSEQQIRASELAKLQAAQKQEAEQ